MSGDNKTSPSSLTTKVKALFSRSYKKLFLLFYVATLTFGFLLALMYPFFPRLIYCGSLFGAKFCTPLGIFLILTASFPGYIFVGNVLGISPNSNTLISLLMVIFFSGAFYFLVGYTIDRLKSKSLTVDRLSRYSIVGIFVFLIFVLLLLS